MKLPHEKRKNGKHTEVTVHRSDRISSTKSQNFASQGKTLSRQPNLPSRNNSHVFHGLSFALQEVLSCPLPPEPNLKWVLEFMSYVRTGLELNDSKISQARLVISLAVQFLQNLYRLLGIFFYRLPYAMPTPNIPFQLYFQKMLYVLSSEINLGFSSLS